MEHTEYLVSARKYRPATFDTVVGQRALTTTLLNAIRTGKLAHAYLFCGPRGVGKTTCARIFAKTINCLSPRSDGEACCQCNSCLTFDRQSSLNIHEMDAASNNSVENIRDLIDIVRIPPQGGKYKVFIIDEVHMLSTAAFNAFLKTLEEPPAHAVFIMATTEKHKVLPTILSRCQVYDFQRMTIQGTVDHLAHVAEKEGVKAEEAALNLIAQKADGGMRDALSIFDQMVAFAGDEGITYDNTLMNLGELDAEYHFRFVDHFLASQVEPCMVLLNEVIAKGFDAGKFIASLASHMRSLLVARDAQTLSLLETSEGIKPKYQEQARRCSPAFLFRALRLCNDCEVSYRQSRNKRLQVELCLIEMAQLLAPSGSSTPLGASGGTSTPSSGPRPESSIKPIFAKGSSTPLGASEGTSTPLGASGGTQQANATLLAEQQATYTPPTQRTGASTPLGASVGIPKKKLLNLNDLRITSTTKPQASAAEAEDNKPQFKAAEQGALTDSNLLQCWQQYATSIETQERALASRLRGMELQRTGPEAFTVIVGGPHARQELSTRSRDIETFVARAGGVPLVTMTVETKPVAEAQEAFSKPHILARMMQTNPALEELVRGAQLEIC